MSHIKYKDIFPQQMTFTATQSAANTTTSTRVPMPIARLPNSRGVQVIEITKISIQYSSDLWLAAAADRRAFALCFRDWSTQAVGYNRASCFFIHDQVMNGAGTEIADQAYEFDMTTGGGRGLLVATDALFASVMSTSLSAAGSVYCKISYRFVSVGLEEYVGIVQMQQSQT